MVDSHRWLKGENILGEPKEPRNYNAQAKWNKGIEEKKENKRKSKTKYVEEEIKYKYKQEHSPSGIGLISAGPLKTLLPTMSNPAGIRPSMR